LTIQSEYVAGDTWAFTMSLADHDAPTWTATIYFENQNQTFSATASASGSDHSFSIAAATTAGYKAGRYRWSIRATSGATVETVQSGWVDVLPNPASSGMRDVRSWTRRTLEAVEATIEGRATDGQLAVTIAGRSISRIPLMELMQIRGQLRGEVRAEEQAENAGLGRNIKVRYARP
jgi:hypothetical protein